ncbi:MAG: cupredoxin domain-containing protein [Acidimicrobiales bacterium]
MWTRTPILPLALAVSLSLAACDDNGNDGNASDGGGNRAGDGDALVIEELAFPDSFSAAAGATVAVENRDNARHSVTSDDGGFDEELAGGESGEFTAPDEPGDYEVVCRFHAGMEMTLTVEE